MPDIVFIHGLGANLGFWYFNIAPAVSDFARVTMFDLRGHGRSSMPEHGYRMQDLAGDLEALLDHLEIGAPHLVGHSLGGAVMAEFAASHPDRAASLTFVDARLKLFQPTMTLADWPHWEAVKPVLDELGIVLKPEEGEISYQLLREIARLQWLAADRGEELMKRLSGSLLAGFTFTGAGGRRAAGQLLRLLESTTALAEMSKPDEKTLAQLKSIQCPVAAVYGAESQTLATHKALQDVWPDLNSWIIPNAGHFFPTTKPESLNTALREFYQNIL
ncbi:alpha/beta hydrolase [Synechococcus sp. CBW1004]|nr:alpha/beta hydrolase [Synechococcus sp. CBW1004]